MLASRDPEMLARLSRGAVANVRQIRCRQSTRDKANGCDAGQKQPSTVEVLGHDCHLDKSCTWIGRGHTAMPYNVCEGR